LVVGSGEYPPCTAKVAKPQFSRGSAFSLMSPLLIK
jgi:hypothetical protein